MFRNLVLVLLVAFFASGCGSIGGNKPQIIKEPDIKVTVKENCRKLPNGREHCVPVHAATPAEEEGYGAYPTDPEARRHYIDERQERSNLEARRRANPEGYKQPGRQQEQQRAAPYNNYYYRALVREYGGVMSQNPPQFGPR